MSIDWITVAAQIANFLVLVWLLKRFLYRPIIDGIDAREAEISRRMAEAGMAQEKAREAEAQYREQHAHLLSSQDNQVAQALRESQGQRDKLLAEARARIEQEQKDWRLYLERERDKFAARLQRAGAETLLELTRKALRDLADERLEAAIVRHVGARLEPLAAELAKAAGDSTKAVASTRETLPETAQQQLRADMERLLPGVGLNFATDPQQAPGLVLRVGGAQVAWTVDSYTDELAGLLGDRLAAAASGRMPADGG